MTEKTENQIVSDRHDWDALAEGWYRTHHWTRFRTELDELSRRWEKGCLLNIGCGHGADFLPFNEDYDLVGLDLSVQMLVQARRYGHKFKRVFELTAGNATNLPFKENVFDHVVAVAALHHLRTPAERTRAFSEIKRVLKPGGEAFITVWNRGQPRFWFAGREAIVSWKLKAGSVKRYHYLYTYRSLRRALMVAGLDIVSLRPESSWGRKLPFFSRNICALVEKPAGTVN